MALSKALKTGAEKKVGFNSRENEINYKNWNMKIPFKPEWAVLYRKNNS